MHFCLLTQKFNNCNLPSLTLVHSGVFPNEEVCAMTKMFLYKKKKKFYFSLHSIPLWFYNWFSKQQFSFVYLCVRVCVAIFGHLSLCPAFNKMGYSISVRKKSGLYLKLISA